MKFLGILLMINLLVSCEKDIFTDKVNDPRYIFDAYWHELDRNYSFFSYLHLNWDSVYAVYQPGITASTSDNDLLKILTNITNLLHDAHTNVYAPMGVTGNIDYFEPYRVNQILLSESYFNSYYVSKVFDYGELHAKDLGYIKIKTFEGTPESFEYLDSVLDSFQNTKGLIIDVRSNRGGFISNCSIVASRFADSSRLACQYRIRNGADHESFTTWIDVNISPCTSGRHYTKPIAILTNRLSYSATEWFVIMSKVIPRITIIGDTTGGGSAMPLIRELPNGWILRTSNTQTRLPSGRDFQFTGIYPDIPVWITAEDANGNVDTILERAIAVIGK